MTQIDTSTAAIEALLKDVTPGPWERDMSYQWPSKVRSLDEKHRHRWVVDVSSFPDSTHTISDARFIAAARELVPALLAERDALRAEVATCVKYRDAYAECDRIGTQAVRDLEAKLTKAVEALETIVDNGGAGSYHLSRTTLAELNYDERS